MTSWSPAVAAERPNLRRGALGLADDSDVPFGRDGGYYSARNSSKGALLRETHSMFRALAIGKSLGEVRRSCLEGRLFRQSARETRRRIWHALHWRFFAWAPPDWVIADIADAAREEVTSPRFIGLVYLHYARRDQLTFDFVTEKVLPQWRDRTREVRRSDVVDFLKIAHEQTGQWRESTRIKLAGNVLSALRDFGLLAGVQRKFIQRPVVDQGVVLHLCRLLETEGLRGRTLLEARDWRLFLWDVQDTSHALVRLAQHGELRFERSGRTVVLDVPKHPLGDQR
jgi:hypothetical protein